MLRLPTDGCAFVYASEVAIEVLNLLNGRPISDEDAGSTITVYLREDELPEYGFRRLILNVYQTKAERQLAFVGRRLALKPGWWSLEQALQTDWETISAEKGEVLHGAARSMRTDMSADDETWDGFESLDMDAFVDDGVRFFRMILNSALYVTSRNALLASQLSNRPVQFVVNGSKLLEHSRRDFEYVEVGRDIESIPVVIDPLKQYIGEAPQTFMDRRRLKVRFMVPGFYRRAPGSKPSSMPTVWVRPHYRGPEIADLLNRPYFVR